MKATFIPSFHRFQNGVLAQPRETSGHRESHLHLHPPARPSNQALRLRPSKQQRTFPDLRDSAYTPGVQPQGVPRQSLTCCLPVAISEVVGRGCYLVEEKYLIPIRITRVSSENLNPEVARSEESGLTSPHCLLEILVLAMSLAPRWCPDCQKRKNQSQWPFQPYQEAGQEEEPQPRRRGGASQRRHENAEATSPGGQSVDHSRGQSRGCH